MKAAKISPLLYRLLEGEPGFFGEERSGGECFFCQGGLGRDSRVPRLFAVAVEGGLLLRLPKKVRDGLIDRGLGQPNRVLPKWVLRPPETRSDDSTIPGSNGGEVKHDPKIHGAPEEWVWMPIGDPETFERRRPHIIETLAFCRHSLQDEQDGME